ncbi:MAG: helix-turn-helix domain-containing protein [Thermoleophilaceae bacterium]
MNTTACRDGLRKAGAQRADAERRRAKTMADLADWTRAAAEQGISIVEIAKLSGVSRPTIYEWLGR